MKKFYLIYFLEQKCSRGNLRSLYSVTLESKSGFALVGFQACWLKGTVQQKASLMHRSQQNSFRSHQQMLVMLIYCRTGFQVLLQQRGVRHSILCSGVWWEIEGRKQALIGSQQLSTHSGCINGFF